jgi:hypothetical protein
VEVLAVMRRLAIFALLLLACGREVNEIRVPVRSFSQVAFDPSQAKSFELWILNQVGRDDNPIQCEELLTRKISPADANVIRLKDPIAGAFGEAGIDVSDIAVGEQNRIFYVDFFDQERQLGNRIGAGCAGSVTIVGGKKNVVAIEIAPPPPAAR